MRISKTATTVGLFVGVIGLVVVICVLLLQSGYPDGTRDGDFIVHGSGWTQRKEGGRLVLLTCDQRTSGMQFVRALPIAIIVDVPPDVEWLPGDQPQNNPSWRYRSSLLWELKTSSGSSAKVEIPYEFDGRRKVFSIAGRTFDLADGNVFHLTGEDEPEPIIHQRVLDPGLAAVTPERFDEAYRQRFPEN